MGEKDKIEESREDGKTESLQEVNENISQEQTIESTQYKTQNWKLQTWKYITIQKLKRKISKNIY